MKRILFAMFCLALSLTCLTSCKQLSKISGTYYDDPENTFNEVVSAMNLNDCDDIKKKLNRIDNMLTREQRDKYYNFVEKINSGAMDISEQQRNHLDETDAHLETLSCHKKKIILRYQVWNLSGDWSHRPPMPPNGMHRPGNPNGMMPPHGRMPHDGMHGPGMPPPPPPIQNPDSPSPNEDKATTDGQPPLIDPQTENTNPQTENTNPQTKATNPQTESPKYKSKKIPLNDRRPADAEVPLPF